MKDKLLLILCSGLIIGIGSYLWLKSAKSQKSVIAIVTTLSHPALEQVRAGFIDNPSDLAIIDFNAEGSMQSANIIAHQIAQDPKIIGILAIGTLAAQSILKVEKKRPIVIAAVSDPGAIIPEDQKNICGLTDSIDAGYQIDTIISMLPELKSISILYSPHEANSASMVKNLNTEAAKRNLRTELIGVYEPQQIANASLQACQKSDAVLIPLDNQLVASMPSVIKATKNKACPVISSNESPIHQGASIAFGVDYKKSGQKARLIMDTILSGKKTPQEIGFIIPDKLDIYINKKIIEEKNMKLNPMPNSHVLSGE